MTFRLVQGDGAVNDNDVYELECGVGGGDSVPVGQHKAEFLGLERVPATDKMREGVRWKFRILEGEHAGKITGRIGPIRPTPKNASDKILGGMLGRQVADEKVSIKDLIGRKFSIIVALGDTGKPRVEMVFPLPEQ
jgi:hypothetical protein